MPDTPLAAQTDVEAALGRSLVSTEVARCGSLLLSASGLIEQYTNYTFVPGEYTMSEQPDGTMQVQIPADSTSSITAVRDIDEGTGTATTLVLGTDYNVRGKKVYLIFPSDRVEIDFTVTAAIAPKVVNLCAAIVARSLAGSPVGATSESVGPYHVTYSNPSGDAYLSKSDKITLAPYKQTNPAIRVLG